MTIVVHYNVTLLRYSTKTYTFSFVSPCSVSTDMCGEFRLKQFNYDGRYGRCMQGCVESNDTSHQSDRHFNKLQQGIVTNTLLTTIKFEINKYHNTGAILKQINT